MGSDSDTWPLAGLAERLRQENNFDNAVGFGNLIAYERMWEWS